MDIEVRPSPSADDVAAFLEIARDELAARDRFLQPIQRWLASEAQATVGLATAFVRPDQRLFVTHQLRSETAFGPLLDAAIEHLKQPVHLSIRHDHVHRLRTATQLGFMTELRTLAFDVPFQRALEWTADRQSSRIETVRAGDVSPDQLFALDTELRQGVPGTDGWQGNRAWFDDELESPEFDPTGYRVARDRTSGELVGLCRFWRNRQGSTLGMIGVRPRYRIGRPALTLLHETMLGASKWGYDTFSTSTARASLQRRLQAIGASQNGGVTQLRLVP